MNLEVELWNKIRVSTSYIEIVDIANDWLPVVWDSARQLRIHPYGNRTYFNCPRIRISDYIRSDVVGTCYPHDAYHGPAIRIVSARRMIKEPGPLFVTLRETILHETQHTIDNSYSVWSSHHNHWFEKRLNHLMTLFPPESL